MPASTQEKLRIRRKFPQKRCSLPGRCGHRPLRIVLGFHKSKKLPTRKTACYAGRFVSVSKNLVEFRPAGRNKMEIHFIRRLCRPDKYISPRKCGICAPKAHKLCAQSRRSPFCQESVSFFDSLAKRPVIQAVLSYTPALYFFQGASSASRYIWRRFSPAGNQSPLASGSTQAPFSFCMAKAPHFSRIQ